MYVYKTLYIVKKKKILIAYYEQNTKILLYKLL